MEVAALQNQLEEIESATQRSVAAEVESAIESGAALVDEAGRGRILQLCRDVRQKAAKLSVPERQHKIQQELQRAAVGAQPWQQSTAGALANSRLDLQQPGAPEPMPRTLAELGCPTGSKRWSLFDWEAWTQARPTLWCYGDAGNLNPKRTEAPYTPLLTHHWLTCMCFMCFKEELEYDVEGDKEPYRVHHTDGG